jgi:hypothetical protein
MDYGIGGTCRGLAVFNHERVTRPHVGVPHLSALVPQQ